VAYGPWPADAFIDKATLAHLIGQINVAQVDDRGLSAITCDRSVSARNWPIQ
jgi:hypothetical protein